MLRFCIWLEAFYLRREGFRVKEMIFEYADMKYSIPSDMEKGGIWILRTGRSRVKPHYFVGPKVSENYALHFVLNGMVSLAYGDEEVTLSEGMSFACFLIRGTATGNRTAISNRRCACSGSFWMEDRLTWL